MASGGLGAGGPSTRVAGTPSGDMGSVELTDLADMSGTATFTGRCGSAGEFSAPVAGITTVGRSTVPVAPPDFAATRATVAVG